MGSKNGGVRNYVLMEEIVKGEAGVLVKLQLLRYLRPARTKSARSSSVTSGAGAIGGKPAMRRPSSAMPSRGSAKGSGLMRGGDDDDVPAMVWTGGTGGRRRFIWPRDAPLEASARGGRQLRRAWKARNLPHHATGHTARSKAGGESDGQALPATWLTVRLILAQARVTFRLIEITDGQ